MFVNRTHRYSYSMKVGAWKALAAIAMLGLSACSKSSVIEEVEEIKPIGTDVMSFTGRVQDNEAETRATGGTYNSPLLTTGFMVSTYKLYNASNQQTVMEKYNVEYKTTGTAWDGNIRAHWDYTQVPGQYERYWDLSGFPYRFHAIAPYPTDPSTVTLDDKLLKINAPYYYQTVHNGLVQTRKADGSVTQDAAEPYMIAQVHRDTEGKDQDLLATPDKVNINISSTNKVRTVWMPFHHLNSKIRFAVYTLHPWASDNFLYIKDLKIRVTSNQFVTAADGYQATCDATHNWRIDTGTSGFTTPTKKNPAELTTPLFQFDGGKDVEGNDLRECQTQATAFFMQSKGGQVQLPQENVQMAVSFKLCDSNGETYKTFTDVPIAIQLPDETLDPLHTWKPGYIYTYYLIIAGLEDKLEITFTATLTPWEDVSGSLVTDLEK